MKRLFVAVGIVGIIVASGAALARPVSALSGDDIQLQIQALLAKVAELTAQLNTLRVQADTWADASSSSSAVTMSPIRLPACDVLTRNLSQGAQGNDVASLQEFLRAQGYFSSDATGYFGPLTTQAVSRWQASLGISPVGAFGPLSRTRLAAWCGQYSSGSLSAAPAKGDAPLIVTFRTNVSLSNSQFIADAGSYKIVFGDGSEYVLPCEGSQATCFGPHTVQHTYASAGTYDAQLIHFGYFGIANPDGSAPTQIAGSARIVVSGGGYACTEEYAPVCGSKQVQCITAPCNPVQQTYSNRCHLNADGATYLHEGACSDDSTDPSANPNCKAWYDGCNSCSRSEPNGPAMCTLRACVWQAPAYCTAYFDGNGSDRPPVISAFSGPTTLSVHETGVWKIEASDPENGALSYRIRWGDENAAPYVSAAADSSAFVQSTSFTHTYAAVGTYTVWITAQDGAGQTSQTSSTVRVEAPDSGKTACTADAMQCPDGSWVGRSGPYCKFVCPATNTSSTGASDPGSGTPAAGVSCVAPPDGRTYADGQAAYYRDWCRPNTMSVYCGSGYKTCRNGAWQ